MDENYDVIVLGTGLTECVLSGILSVEGKRCCTSTDKTLRWRIGLLKPLPVIRQVQTKLPKPELKGRDRDWCVDLIPKFLMANGELTNILVNTDVTRYMEFKQIAASYVYRNGRIAKVPPTPRKHWLRP